MTPGVKNIILVGAGKGGALAFDARAHGDVVDAEALFCLGQDQHSDHLAASNGDMDLVALDDGGVVIEHGCRLRSNELRVVAVGLAHAGSDAGHIAGSGWTEGVLHAGVLGGTRIRETLALGWTAVRSLASARICLVLDQARHSPAASSSSQPNSASPCDACDTRDAGAARC